MERRRRQWDRGRSGAGIAVVARIWPPTTPPVSALDASVLDEADRVACRVPEGIYHGTAFGSASVRIHRVTLAVDLADADAALRFADGWVPPPEIPAERRSHYFVDLGRAHLQAGQYDQTISALRVAREIAPQHIRVHPDVRSTIFFLRDAGVTEIGEFC